jgi:hypothetical protein
LHDHAADPAFRNERARDRRARTRDLAPRCARIPRPFRREAGEEEVVRERSWITSCAVAAALALAPPGDARAHLLITEVGYDTVDETSPTSEFVEILNPDAASVSLANVWLVGDEDAYPYLVNGPVSPISLNNFIHRFPAITLAPGEIAVICQDSDAFLAEFFPGGGLGAFLAQPGTQRLLEVTQDGSADGVADMIPWGSNPAGTLSMANNGECLGLVTWDGASDLVRDLDWTCWLTTTFIPNKDVDYPLGIDGPDADLETSFFANDLGTGAPAPDAPQGSSIHRPSIVETGEVASGGNGVSGHDETSENWTTWTIAPDDPGVCALTAVAVGDVPGAASRWVEARPNPFVEQVRIGFTVPRAGRVRLAIHDLQGRVVATLIDGAMSAGSASANWDGRDGAGRAAPAGVYLVRLETAERISTRTLVRVR